MGYAPVTMRRQTGDVRAFVLVDLGDAKRPS
jgi:hypothetical protein